MSERIPPLIRPALATTDRAEWGRLFAEYREFYQLVADDVVVERVWSWIISPAQETQCLVAEIDGSLVGIAHYRAFMRPSTGTIGLWLDDLFVDPKRRGHGIARALISSLQQIAREQGYSVVRWITAESNDQARMLYDAVATRTHWVTYDATP